MIRFCPHGGELDLVTQIQYNNHDLSFQTLLKLYKFHIPQIFVDLNSSVVSLFNTGHRLIMTCSCVHGVKETTFKEVFQISVAEMLFTSKLNCFSGTNKVNTNVNSCLHHIFFHMYHANQLAPAYCVIFR